MFTNPSIGHIFSHSVQSCNRNSFEPGERRHVKKHQSETSEDRGNAKSGRSPDALREQAENRLSARSTPTRLQEARKALHELEVHQIELEMQNETLRQTQATLVAAHCTFRYAVNAIGSCSSRFSQHLPGRHKTPLRGDPRGTCKE